MKKLLLGLGAMSLAILPVAAVVSCGSTNETKIINALPVSQREIDIAITEVIEAQKIQSTTPSEITTRDDIIAKSLSPIFTGITGITLKGIKVVAVETIKRIINESTGAVMNPEIPGKITLSIITPVGTDMTITQPNYSFANFRKILVSQPAKMFVKTNLVPFNRYEAAILAVKTANSLPVNDNTSLLAKERALITALGVFFDGITIDNIRNIQIAIKDKTIEITSNEGFSFVSLGSNESQILSSKIELQIELQRNITETEINNVINYITDNNTVKPEDYDSQLVRLLQPLLIGIDINTIKNFKIVIVGNTITLRANEGFLFPGSEATIVIEAPAPIK